MAAAASALLLYLWHVTRILLRFPAGAEYAAAAVVGTAWIALNFRLTARFANLFNRMCDNLKEERDRSKLLARKIISSQEEERKRIARDLHDEAYQLLAAIFIDLEQLKRLATETRQDGGGVREKIDHLQVLAEKALTEIRCLAHNLMPTILDDLGIRRALEWLFSERMEKQGIRVHLAFEGFQDESTGLPPDVQLTLFRVAQESITNIMKHSRASSVDVSLRKTHDNIQMEIGDNGGGFDLSAAVAQEEKGMGISGMMERVELLCGKFELDSRHGTGSDLRIMIPIGRGA